MARSKFMRFDERVRSLIRTRLCPLLPKGRKNIKAQIIKHYQHLSDREGFVTAEMVRNAYQGLGSEYETLLGAFEKDLATLKKRVDKDRASGTYKIQVRSRNYVASFLQACHRRTDISMQAIDEVASLVEELTPDFIKEFASISHTLNVYKKRSPTLVHWPCGREVWWDLSMQRYDFFRTNKLLSQKSAL